MDIGSFECGSVSPILQLRPAPRRTSAPRCSTEFLKIIFTPSISIESNFESEEEVKEAEVKVAGKCEKCDCEPCECKEKEDKKAVTKTKFVKIVHSYIDNQ